MIPRRRWAITATVLTLVTGCGGDSSPVAPPPYDPHHTDLHLSANRRVGRESNGPSRQRPH